jgi:hypothetical protein
MTQLPAKIPALKGGNDQAAAKQLTKLFSDAQTGMRRIVALGLFAWEVKETRLKHGEWGPWLAAHCPALARVDSGTGKAKASNALSSYMELTKNVLEQVGFGTIEKYLSHVSNSLPEGICQGGKWLLLPDKKLPKEALPLKEKICSLIDGKTKKQLFSEFKQAVEDSAGSAKPKRGNLSGKGCTKEHREAAALAEEQARITELTLTAEDTAKWLLDNSDHKHIGLLPDETFSKLFTSLETALGYMRNVAESRRASQKGQS